MEIVNKQDLDEWLFQHAAIEGHKCDSVKGTLHAVQPGDEPAEEINIAWVDTVTGEKIDVIYSETTSDNAREQ